MWVTNQPVDFLQLPLLLCTSWSFITFYLFWLWAFELLRGFFFICTQQCHNLKIVWYDLEVCWDDIWLVVGCVWTSLFAVRTKTRQLIMTFCQRKPKIKRNLDAIITKSYHSKKVKNQKMKFIFLFSCYLSTCANQ